MEAQRGHNTPGAHVLGEFQLIRPIGRGGVGVVWEAWQTSLRRQVAVKVLSAGWARDSQARERFLAEAEAGARLNHPGIVAVHAVGEHEGTLYIAQELVEGARTLADLLDQWRRATTLPADHYARLAQLFAAVADALQAAHEAGVVHRDIKPGNLLITPDGLPKVADFGIARIENGATLSRTGDVLGTPFYMSPEHVHGHRGAVTARSDVFSLAAVLYEALTLVRPFEGDTSQQVMQRILSHDPPDPRRQRSKVPSDLAVICTKGLAKDPKRRYSTMAEFAADLRRYLGHQPIRARPPGRLQVAARWARRHPVLSTSGGVAISALAVITTLLLRVREEVQTSQDTLTFLVDVFAQSDPDLARKAQVSVKEVLDKAAERVRGQFDDRPHVEARILYTLGIVYESLGAYQEAYEQLGGCLELQKRTLGSDATETIVTTNLLGATALRLRRLGEAEELLQAAVLSLTSRLGPRREETCSARYNLGHLRLLQGRNNEAAEILVATFVIQSEVLGAEARDTLQTASALASAQLLQGRSGEARELATRYLKIAQRVQGPDSLAALSLQMTLGMAWQMDGELGEAERTYRDALKGLDRVVATDHPHRQTALNNVAGICADSGRLDEALDLYRHLLEARENASAPNPVLVAVTRMSLGRVEARLGQLESAEEHLRTALLTLTASAPETNRDRLSAMTNYADLLLLTERAAEAEPLCRAAWNTRLESLGPDHSDTLYSQATLVRILDDLGRSENALALSQDLLARTPLTSPERTARQQMLDSIQGRPIKASAPTQR